MKFQLNTTEMLDWQEVWCFRCENDHEYSHTDEYNNGCEILRRVVIGDDVLELQPRDANWQSQIPAPVSCDKFKLCNACPGDAPDLERRQGLTRRQFMDEERDRVLALPVLAEVE